MTELQAARWVHENGRRRQRVYISGPITGGDRNWNQYQANVMHKRLMHAGFAVLNPMPTGVLPFAWEAKDQGGLDHATWLESDLAWVLVSDMVLRLPGESKGGDIETKFADEIGVPVYTPESFPWPKAFVDATWPDSPSWCLPAQRAA